MAAVSISYGRSPKTPAASGGRVTAERLLRNGVEADAGAAFGFDEPAN